MSDDDFKVGSTVRLADIPSPIMRVIAIEPVDGRLRCFWFNRRNEPEVTLFRRELCVKAAPYVHRPRAPDVDESMFAEVEEHAETIE